METRAWVVKYFSMGALCATSLVLPFPGGLPRIGDYTGPREWFEGGRVEYLLGPTECTRFHAWADVSPPAPAL